MQNSVAVGTVERGLSPSRVVSPWELFSPYEMVLSICILCTIALNDCP